MKHNDWLLDSWSPIGKEHHGKPHSDSSKQEFKKSMFYISVKANSEYNAVICLWRRPQYNTRQHNATDEKLWKRGEAKD